MSSLLRRLGACALLLGATGLAQAQTYVHQVYLDRDQNAATGCSVVSPAGTIAGAEARLTATVGSYPAAVSSLSLAQCAGGSFGAEATLSASYPIGFDLGAGGSDVIEFAVDLAVLTGANGNDWTLWFLSTSSTSGGADLVGPVSANGLGIPLVPPAIPQPELIPALSPWALLLLSLTLGVAMVWAARRYRGLLPVLVVGAALSITGIAWAANYLLDGMVGDWDVPPLATDPAGDHSTGEAPGDLRAVYAARQQGRIFFRADIAEAQIEKLIAGLLDTDHQVDENAANGTTVGELRAVTTGLGSLLQFQLQSQAPGAAFAIDADGTLSVADGSLLDAETTPTFDLSVQASINGVPFLTIAVPVTVAVGDLNEAPVVADQAFDVDESSAAGTEVGTVIGSDADVGNVLAWSISGGNTHGAFAIDPASGALTVASAAAVVPGNSPFELEVVASDGTLSDLGIVVVTVNDLNFPPETAAGAAVYATDEDVALDEAAPGLLAGFGDPDGDALSVLPAPAVAPTQGAVVLNADGSFTYTPAADANGADSFSYTVSDGAGGTVDRVVNISINPVDDAPVAVADAYSVDEGGTLAEPAAGVLGNDSDVEGDALTAVLDTAPAHASSFSLNADGSFSYSHDGSETSSDSFTYHASGGGQDSATVTVTLSITAQNDLPVPTDDAHTLNEGATLAIAAPGVLGNDTDAESDPLVAALVAAPAHGALTLAADGSFSYTHDGSESPASDSFSYRANDGTGDSGVATVALTITPVDDAPVAVDDTATLAEDAAATGIDVLANDTDADGGTAMTVQSVFQPTSGVVVITGGGTGLSYAPDADFCGADSFTYTLAPGGATATVAITVTCVDDAPVAVADAATVAEDSGANGVAVLANDTDVDGGPISITSVTQGSSGSVAISGGGTGLSYTPSANFCGADGFSYTLTPGGSSTTVSMTVSCADDAPVAVDDGETIDEDSGANTIDVLANDTDLDGGPIAITAITQGSSGSVAINNGGADLSYTPAADFCGNDSFTYTLSPGGASATVAMAVSCLNDGPQLDLDADDDQGTPGTGFAVTYTEGEAAVLLQDPADPAGAIVTDVDSANLASLTVSISNLLDTGNETLSADVSGTSVTANYDPATGTLTLSGPDTLVNFGTVLRTVRYANSSTAPDDSARVVAFVANDGSTDGNLAVSTVAIVNVDTDPTAVDDATTLAEDAGASAIAVLSNDTDPDAGPISIDSVTDPALGTVAITGGGSGLTYTPDADACNDGTPTDDFSYTLAPGGSSATVRVTLTCSDDAPVAVADSAALTEDDGASAIDVLQNDTDVDSGAISIGSVDQPTNGTVVITGGGTGLTYQPNANYCNSDTGIADSFTYTLSPGGSTAGVSVSVACVEDDPVAVADAVTVVEDSGANALDVLANDTDPDAGPISITAVTQAASGSVAITGGGTGVTYTPNADYCNNPPGSTPDAFTYTLTPGGSSTTVSVSVTCVDDPPVAVADAATIIEDAGASAIDVLANDTDPDGGPISVTGVTQAANGAVAITGGGTGLSYQPNANYCNSNTGTPDTFTYTLTPGGSSTTVSVSVTCVNDAPTVTGTASAAVHTHIAISVPDGASDLFSQFTVNDVDGPTPIIIGGAIPTTSANGGEVAVTASTGAFTYNPPANFAGPDTFAVQFCDSEPTPACSAPQTVTLNVAGPEIWFADDDAVAGGDGTLLQPFQTLAAAATAANQSGNRIFLHSGSYTGGVTLADGVQLYGHAAGSAAATDDEFHEVLGVTPVALGVALPGVNQAAPQVGAGAAVTAITVGNGAIVDGVHLQTAAATATALAGTAFGTLAVDEVSIAGSGRALNLASGTLNGNFTSVSSSGGSDNVALNAVAGTVNLGTGALSGASGSGLSVGGTLSLSYAGSIANASAGSGRAVLASGHSVGTIMLTGAIQASGSSEGLLFSNADGTYVLSGVVTLTGNQGVVIGSGSSGAISLTNTASAITNPAASAIWSNGSAPNLSYAGTITKTNNSSTALRFDNNTGGTVALSGAAKTLSTGTQNAVQFANNGTMSLLISGGGLDIDTTTGIGFNATGGGTITVQGTGNSINSVSGTALNVSGTTIAATGLTFQRIDAGNAGAPADPGNGIVLANTGTLGGLTVTGAGGVAGSGGTIQNVVGADGAAGGNSLYLIATRNVSLSHMNIITSQNNGLYGSGVRGLRLDGMQFSGSHGTSNSGTFDESAVHLIDLGGTVNLVNSTFNGGAYNAVLVENTLGTNPALTLLIDNAVVSHMQGTTADVRGTALLVHATDGTADVTISNSDVTVWWGNAIHVVVQGSASGTTRITDNFADNTNGALAGAGGIAVAGGTHAYRIANNIVRHTNGAAISADRVNFGTIMQGTIENNTIGVSGDNNSGSAAGAGIFASHHGPGTTTHRIRNNTIRQVTGQAASAIWVLTGDAAGFGGSGSLNATVTGNDIQETGSPSLAAHMAILTTVGTSSTAPGDTDLACLDIGGTTTALRNNIVNFNTGLGHLVTSENRLRINARFGTTSRFPGYTGAATGVASQTDIGTYLLGRNTASNSTNANLSTGGFLNTSPAGSACPQPAL